MDNVYLCIHANAWIASACIAIVDNIVLLCLHLPFRKIPAPEKYTTFSNAENGLDNDLLRDILWDVTELQ